MKEGRDIEAGYYFSTENLSKEDFLPKKDWKKTVFSAMQAKTELSKVYVTDRLKVGVGRHADDVQRTPSLRCEN